MCLFFNFFGHQIPSYGFMIALGVIIANCIALCLIKRYKLDINDFFILQGYCLFGAYVGSKGLYLAVSYKTIEWHRLLDFAYLNDFMKTGFVFYGGLILGTILFFLAGKIHKIDAKLYAKTFIFLIPMIHAFGRLGCFFAGCCYGIPYDKFGAVIFPANSYALANVPLFPVQLVEAIILLMIACIILYLQIAKKCKYTIEIYLILYAITRFFLEYVRYDSARGKFWLFSTSQWISICVIVVVVFLMGENKKKSRVSSS